MTTILFLQKSDYVAEHATEAENHLRAYYNDLTLYSAGSPDDVPNVHADAVITPTLPWLTDGLQRLKSYKWIHFLSAGVEKIWDMPFPNDQVLMTKSSGVHGPPMSEYALGAMLYFAKGFHRFVHQSQKITWQRAWLDELTGRDLMILGTGHIGSAIAQRAQAFGMRVHGVNRTPRSQTGIDHSIRLDEVAAVLPSIDYMVVCLPLTPETNGLIDDAFLSRLKRGSILIDISRGGIVKENAILNALDEGKLAGVALDVFEQEPLPPNSNLWNRRDVLVTPHVSGTTPYYLERALNVFIENAQSIERGLGPTTPVDPERGY